MSWVNAKQISSTLQGACTNLVIIITILLFYGENNKQLCWEDKFLTATDLKNSALTSSLAHDFTPFMLQTKCSLWIRLCTPGRFWPPNHIRQDHAKSWPSSTASSSRRWAKQDAPSVSGENWLSFDMKILQNKVVAAVLDFVQYVLCWVTLQYFTVT